MPLGIIPHGRICSLPLLRKVGANPEALLFSSPPARSRADGIISASRLLSQGAAARCRCARLRQTSVAEIGAASRRAQANTAHLCCTLQSAVSRAACCRVAYSAASGSVAALHVSCSQRRTRVGRRRAPPSLPRPRRPSSSSSPLCPHLPLPPPREMPQRQEGYGSFARCWIWRLHALLANGHVSGGVLGRALRRGGGATPHRRADPTATYPILPSRTRCSRAEARTS